jgi:hypothetical protein
LKEQKVLQDDLQDPLTRVSLRGIKDFSKPFETTVQGQKFLFWRFYNEPSDNAESLAKQLAKKLSVEQPEHKVEPKIEPRIEPKIELKIEPRPSLIIEPKPVVVERIERTAVEKPVLVQEVQAVLEEHKIMAQARVEQRYTPIKHESHVEHHVEHHTEQHEHHDKALKSEPHQAKVSKTPKSSKPKTPAYNFLEVIKSYFISKGLDMLSKEKIKKTEYDMILKNHDTNEYIYCKAKDKSSVSEGDLAPALIFAQSKKMPCLFVSTGELTKKAELMMSNELKGMKFERILINNNLVNK